MTKFIAVVVFTLFALGGAAASDPWSSMCELNAEVHHGGGLNACGCHFNRKSGECHCHQNRECGCACQPSSCG